MSDLCTGFEPQNYLKERCKKCFRPKDKHTDHTESSSFIKKERRKSWKERNMDNGAPDDDDTEALSVSSFLSATSKGMSSAKSVDSVNDTKSMVTAVSGSIGEEERAMTPTENEVAYIMELKEEIAQLREMNRALKEEKLDASFRQRLQNAEGSEGSLLAMLEERLNHSENQLQDFRDENTVLKCELRELQETTYAQSDEQLRKKIKETEALCDELMEENEQLKADVKDLQVEIEEMQDQYREEEIEEFRELQRELEMNAKNCRILQFKLRKTERQKEQIEAEKTASQNKLDELTASNPEKYANSRRSDSARVKELESELRIAKEVSVRLHNELEQTEEKRCKLEDDIFYLKEKVRELQTQNKWREARNKTEYAVKRLSAELAASVPVINESDMSKELRDTLEREIDLREQLRFAEEDLKRTQLRMQDVENENDELLKKLSKASKLRPPMTRSASDGQAHLQLELAESQVQHLNTKVERLEKTNDHLSKRIVELEADFIKHGGGMVVHSNGGEFKLTPEMEQDMSKMLATISDLERKNNELSLQIKQLETKNIKPNFVVSSGSTTTELRNEQDKRKALEVQVNELKATLLKTDQQKIITLATKIEQLNSQLHLSNERYTTIHKKLSKEDSIQYNDELKKKVETLELQISDLKAKENVSVLRKISPSTPSVDELEQCCEVLASIETQTSRLCKQFEKIDSAQKDERRRSLSKDSGAMIMAELANVMKELKGIGTKFEHIKVKPTINGNQLVPPDAKPQTKKCEKCVQNEQVIEDQQNEINFYKKKNKDLTNQVLQTEDRWTIEIEKQRQIFENEIKTLGLRISDMKRANEEQNEILDSKSATLIEKSKSLEEQEERVRKQSSEVESLKKELQEMSTEKKSVKEFEIKYKKLESIFESEREKMNTERSRSKTELATMKKMRDDLEQELKKTLDDAKKHEMCWKQEKSNLEKEIVLLKSQLPEEHLSTNGDTKEEENVMDKSYLRRQDSEKLLIVELKKMNSVQEKKIIELEANLDEVKISNAELKDQLAKANQGWNKDKESFSHKTRQTEKIRTVEIDAMQQKFSSRMRIMEDTNKSLHSQLVLARRERDTHKETLISLEKKIKEDSNYQQNNAKTVTETSEKLKNIQRKLDAKEEEIERLNTDLRLTKEARKADQILMNIERPRGKTDKLDADLNAMEIVKKQYRDSESFYSKEIERLNRKLSDLTLEKAKETTETQKIIKELRETIRVFEIEQRNSSQKNDNQIAAKEMIESEREKLQQMVHLNELQKLTRKYRLSSIIDQLQYVSETARKIIKEGENDGLRYIINQLVALRDDDIHNNLCQEDRCNSALGDRISNAGYAPSVSDFGEGTYDNISQSSFSVRSVNSMPLRHAIRKGPVTTNGGSLTISDGTEPVYSQPDKPPTCHSTLPNFSKRSFSTESTNGFDKYGKPMKKSSYNDVTSLSIPRRKKTSDEYNSMPRTASFDNRSQISDGDSPSIGARSNSAGVNFLYRVRREELARGGQPSVKLMAKAFEAIDEPKTEKRGFFGIRKSRSVETTQSSKQKTFEEAADTALMHSLNKVDDSTSHYATLPRGSRNPFKNMGTRLVERVRRSLSRSSRQSRDSDREEEIEVQVMKKPEKPVSSPKKTKKKSAEAKARKTSLQP